jgi:diguanylate cyclase
LEKEKNDKNIIRIILNINKEVLYSNVNINMAKNYLKVLISSYDSFNDMPVQSCFKKYQVVIDRFILNNQTFFLIVIAKMADCNNCVKAIRDEVTGLYNRNYLEFIKREALPINMDKYLSLILIDVDNLKMLNDTYGHLAGDKVIRIVGQAIKKGIRQKDLGIRFGGDEFIILLPTKDKMATEKVVTRIRETIHEMAKKHKIDIEVSVGIASSNNTFSIEEMIRMADIQLYEQKIIKREQKKEDETSGLANEILEIKEELNKKVVENGNNLSSIEILDLSQRLDDLIVKYLE